MRSVIKLLVLVVALVPAYPGLYASSPTSSVPVKVELFPDSGRVTRLIELEVTTSGSGELRLTGLPLGLNRSAITANVVEGEPLRWERLEYSRARANEDFVTPDLQRLRDELQAAEAEYGAWQGELAALRERMEHRKAVLESLRQGLSRAPTAEILEAVEKAHASYVETRTAVESDLRSTEAKRPEWERRLQYLREAVAAEEQVARTLSGEVLLGYTATTPGARRIVLQYLVDSARWSPHYRVRAESDAGRIEWEWLADIRQSTGENWDGVEITLSTAPGRSSGDVAEVWPVILQPWTEPSARELRARARDVLEMEAFAVESAAPLPPPSPVVNAGMTQFQVRLPGVLRVPGNGSSVQASVFRENFEAALWSEAAPLVEPTAYLRGELVNGFEAPILAGPTEIFVDGVRTGQGRVAHIQVGESFELGLGRNDNLKIERKTITHISRTRGLIGRTRVHERDYQTTIESRMAVVHSVRIRDRFPVVRDAKIELDVAAPLGLDVEEESGRFTWATAIEPGKSESYRTTFTVSHPDDMRIRGDF